MTKWARKRHDWPISLQRTNRRRTTFRNSSETHRFTNLNSFAKITIAWSAISNSWTLILKNRSKSWKTLKGRAKLISSSAKDGWHKHWSMTSLENSESLPCYSNCSRREKLKPRNNLAWLKTSRLSKGASWLSQKVSWVRCLGVNLRLQLPGKSLRLQKKQLRVVVRSQGCHYLHHLHWRL